MASETSTDVADEVVEEFSGFFDRLLKMDMDSVDIIKQRRIGILVDEFSKLKGRLLIRGRLLYDVAKHRKRFPAPKSINDVQVPPPSKQIDVTVVLLRDMDEPVKDLRSFTDASRFWVCRPDRHASKSVLLFGSIEKQFKVLINWRFNVKASNVVMSRGSDGDANIITHAVLECMFCNSDIQPKRSP